MRGIAEMSEGVNVYVPKSNLPVLRLPRDQFYYFRDAGDADQFFREKYDDIISLHGSPLGKYYGIDAEWNRGRAVDDGVCWLQVSFKGLPVVVNDIYAMKAFPHWLKKILEDGRLIPCGRQIGGDLNRLLKGHGINVKQRLEIGQIAKTYEDGGSTGVKPLAERILNVTLVDKETGQSTDYERESSSRQPNEETLRYAATDALVHRLLASQLLQLVSAKLEGARQPQEFNIVKPGSLVDIIGGGRVVARGAVIKIGNYGGMGVSFRYGGQLVGQGKALVQVDEVIVPSWKLPCGYEDDNADEPNYLKGTPIGDVCKKGYSDMILLQTSHLRVPPPEEDAPELPKDPVAGIDSGSVNSAPSNRESEARRRKAGLSPFRTFPFTAKRVLTQMASDSGGVAVEPLGWRISTRNSGRFWWVKPLVLKLHTICWCSELSDTMSTLEFCDVVSPTLVTPIFTRLTSCKTSSKRYSTSSCCPVIEISRT